MIAYVGCRTTKARNAHGEGIAVYDVSTDGKWTHRQTLFVEENPSYLCFDNERKNLYSVHGDITKASSYRILEDGTLEHLNTIEIGGRNPVDIAPDKDNKNIIIATLQGGTLYTVKREEDGALGEIISKYTFEGKEEGKVSTVHQCYWDKTQQYMISCAQGRINGYGQMRVLKYDAESGTFSQTAQFMARTWDEPRHVAMHSNNRWIYMCEEKGNKVLFFRFDESDGSIQPMQELTTVPETELRYSDASEVMIDPTGNYVVVSNRYTDTLAIYTIDPQTGFLRIHGFTPCLCKTPRFFCFGPDGHCYVLGEDSDEIVDFVWDAQNGRLIFTGNVVASGSPTCLIFR